MSIKDVFQRQQHRRRNVFRGHERIATIADEPIGGRTFLNDQTYGRYIRIGGRDRDTGFGWLP